MWRLLARRGLGALGLLIATLAAAGFVLFMIVVVATFARGDRVPRAMIGFGIAFALGVALAAVGFTNGSARSIARAPLTWVFTAFCLGAIGWAAFGIDSTREVIALPEANLTYPGAVETRRSTQAADGAFDGQARAILHRKFTTVDPYTSVEAFYVSTLADQGWERPVNWSSNTIHFTDWSRAGFMVQLSHPTSDSSQPGEGRAYDVSIYGPPK
jgi:hypothetical protein